MERRRSRRTVARAVWSMAALALFWAAGAPTSAEEANAAPGPAVAVADFDNFDSAGESRERTAQHAARVDAFATLLRADLAAEARYRIVSLSCAAARCSPDTLPAADLLAAARQAGARLLVYGGIHKMSTLIQWAVVQAVDLQSGKLILDRRISFRGDTDEAFRRAAEFVARDLRATGTSP